MIFTFINETLTWALSLSLPLPPLEWLTYTDSYTRKIRCHHRALSLSLSCFLSHCDASVARTFHSCSFALFLVSFRNGTCNLWLSFVCCLVSSSFFVFLSIHDELEIAHFWAATADSLDHFPLELQVSLIRMRECAKHTHTTVQVFVCVCVRVFCDFALDYRVVFILLVCDTHFVVVGRKWCVALID